MRHFCSKKELAEYVVQYLPEGYLILIKGSRGLQMEKIIEYLERA